MRSCRKLIAVVVTGTFALGLVPLAGCKRHDTDKASIEFKGSGTKGKVTVETKTHKVD